MLGPIYIIFTLPMNAKKVAWSNEIGCDGGPVIVANLDDFRHWHGCEPFDASRATELHYWSPFTSELPEEWRPNGPTGHQYLASANPSETREILMSVLCKLWPGTDVDRSDGTWCAIRPDGRILNAALSPESEYDRAIRHLGDDAIHRFGNDAIGYLWSASPGMVRINVDEKRDFLLLSQVEFADDDADAERAYSHALSADCCDAAPSNQYRVTSGPVVVAWSPNSARDMSKPLGDDNVAPSLPGTLLDLATDSSGALLWIEPGLYESTLQYHEEDSWGISWCRLQRLDSNTKQR